MPAGNDLSGADEEDAEDTNGVMQEREEGAASAVATLRSGKRNRYCLRQRSLFQSLRQELWGGAQSLRQELGRATVRRYYLEVASELAVLQFRKFIFIRKYAPVYAKDHCSSRCDRSWGRANITTT